MKTEMIRSNLFRVSVIVPTYNQKERLKTCLDALIKQKYNNYEIIVVDDGSIDNTEQLVKKYKNIRYIKKPNGGSASARNKGIAIAKGEIIAFTDDDCIPSDDWLKKALPFFKNPVVMGVEGMTLSNDIEITPTSISTINLHGKKYSTCNIFYRLDILKSIGGFNEMFKSAWGEDADLANRILKIGTIEFVPSVRVYHPIKKYTIKDFFKKSLSLKRTYWQVLSVKYSKQIVSFETLIFYPFYFGLFLFLLKLNTLSLFFLIYIYLTTFLFHNLFLTKGRAVDIFRHKKTIILLSFLWWIIIFTDTIFRIMGIIRFRRILL